MMDGAVRIGADSPVSKAEAATLFGPLSELPALILAVSGGPDSTALMWLAARWRDALPHPPRLIAVTVDHGLRPESVREALGVKRLARTLEVEHRTLRWTGAKPKTGIQEAARNARYRLLADVARKAGATHVLTAHTLDDQAETVLFRLARGSGLGGLRGMALEAPLPSFRPGPWGGPGMPDLRLLRPLLPIAKSRLVATLAAAKVPFADDPSNRDARFTRPRLRELMPGLAAEGLDARRFAALAGRMDRANQAIEQAVDQALARLSPGPWNTHDAIVFLPGFANLPAEIALRALGRAIARVGEGPIELGKLEALHTALVASAPKGRAVRFRRTLAGALVTWSRERLTVERAPTRRVPKSRAKTFTKPR
jgi:tRNA(Ile)-lysidine synthase